MAKKINIRTLVIIVIFALLIIAPAAFILYTMTEHIPATKIDGRGVDTLVFSQDSPDEKHCLSIFISEGKHATVGDFYVVIVSAKESGERWKGKDAWSLYFGSRSTDIAASWIDNETIMICSAENNKNRQFELKMNIYQDEF